MTLDEAIKHYEEIASQKEQDSKYYRFSRPDKIKEIVCMRCAEEYGQLAEWLKELKKYKEEGRELDKTGSI